MKKICVIVLSFILVVGSLFAQSKAETTVVASADGATKEEATKMALRSVIEQAFGVYVSSNTSLLNDEIVQNEVATISSGNIKEYKVISSDFINGHYYVTLQATVSLKKLFDYSKEQAVKKGMTVQINGEKLNNDFQLAYLNYELNKKAERLAINNMIKQLEELTKSVPLLDYEMELTEPKMEKFFPGWKISGKLCAKFNENTARFFDLFISTIEAVSMNESEIKDAENYRFETYSFPCHIQHKDEYCLRNPYQLYKYLYLGLDLLFLQRVSIADNMSEETIASVRPDPYGGKYLIPDPYVGGKYLIPDPYAGGGNYLINSWFMKMTPTLGCIIDPSRLYVGIRRVKGKKIKYSYRIGSPIQNVTRDSSPRRLDCPKATFVMSILDIEKCSAFSIKYQYPSQSKLDAYNSYIKNYNK